MMKIQRLKNEKECNNQPHHIISFIFARAIPADAMRQLN